MSRSERVALLYFSYYCCSTNSHSNDVQPTVQFINDVFDG
jgi:hypothetical protein